MGRRYFCDYCERSFIDDVDARKKHLSSAHHQKLRNNYYASFKDVETLYREEVEKEPCRHFHTHSGNCFYGDNCKRSHYTEEQIWQMKEMIQYKNRERSDDVDGSIPTFEEWLLKYKQNCAVKNERIEQIFWSYPEQLMKRDDLPPSLVKMSSESFKDSVFNEWGKIDDLQKQ